MNAGDRLPHEPRDRSRRARIGSRWPLLAIVIAGVALLGLGLLGLSVPGQIALAGQPPKTPQGVAQTPVATSAPSAPLTPHESAMQRAYAFEGGNDDWEPYIETFTFDNGVSIDLALVPVGCFPMGLDRTLGLGVVGGANGGEQCFEQPFWVGRYEVTNAQYKQCVGSRACDAAEHYGQILMGSTLPIVGIDLRRAYQYVAWLSAVSGQEFDLLTEAEWEYVARGPDAWFYPWGNTFDGQNLNFCDSLCDFDWHEPDVTDGYRVTAPVGAFSPAGDSWVGAADLAGNVWEWVGTAYQDYPYDPAAEVRDLAETDLAWIAHGGGWDQTELFTRAAYRLRIAADMTNYTIGFRVVCRTCR